MEWKRMEKSRENMVDEGLGEREVLCGYLNE
jgi:hypothetical protein